MAYFPIFVDMADKKVLVVGGGRIAAEKLDKLLRFTKEITVIAEAVNEETARFIKEHCLTLFTRSYHQGDADGFDVVVVATDTVDVHRAIYEETRDKRIWVNSVDNTDYCDFIFPSFVQRGDLTVAFSTGGASPAFTKRLRRHCETQLPEAIDDFLREMKHLRTVLPKGKERMEKFEAMVEEFFEENFAKD